MTTPRLTDKLVAKLTDLRQNFFRGIDDSGILRNRLTILFGLFFVLLSSVQIFIRHAIAPIPNLVLIIYIACGFAIFALLAHTIFNPRQKSAAFALPAIIMAALLLPAYHGGGVSLPGMPLIMILPAVAVILTGSRLSIWYLIACEGVFLTFHQLDKLGILPEPILPTRSQVRDARFLALVTTSIILYVLAALYERFQKQTAQRIRDIQNLHPNGIAEINALGQIVSANSQFLQLIGCEHNSREILGKTVKELFSQLSDTDSGTLNELLAEEESDKPKLMRTRTGTWLELQYRKFTPAARHPYRYLVINDCTEQLKKQELSAQEAKISMIGHLVVTYNHQINNPLTVAFGRLQMMECSNPQDKAHQAEIQKSLSKIRDVVRKIAELESNAERIEEDQSEGRTQLKLSR